jgi:hypothetical protein
MPVSDDRRVFHTVRLLTTITTLLAGTAVLDQTSAPGASVAAAAVVATPFEGRGRLAPGVGITRPIPIVRLVPTATATSIAITSGALPDSGQPAGAATCVGDADDLTGAFAATPDGLEGADYQRAIDLPDGRRLWTFQDAYVAVPGRSDALVHNVAVVQDGTCFDLLHGGTSDHPESWLATGATTAFEHWFWPLGATLPGDGTVRIFVAELEERGGRYLANATPIATWIATVDAATLTPVSFDPAPDPSADLYGWSVASDERFTYLYGHCYRQFGFGFLGHDGCTVAVTVARTSHDLRAPPRYWDGAGWVADPAAAVNVAPSVAPDGTPRAINPTQVARVDDRWIAVTKEGDWWGSRIYLDVAAAPSGPWTTVAVLDGAARDTDENTYFASIIAAGDGSGKVLIGLSHNRWDGGRSSVYRPTFQSIPLTRWTDAAPRTRRCSSGRAMPTARQFVHRLANASPST